MLIFVVHYKLIEFLEAEKTLGKLSQFKDMKAEKDPGMRSDCRSNLQYNQDEASKSDCHFKAFFKSTGQVTLQKHRYA